MKIKPFAFSFLVAFIIALPFLFIIFWIFFKYAGDVVAEIAERFEIDVDAAESLLDGSDSVWNHDFSDAENDWFIQTKRGECAKKMGFDGCKDHDEQGAVYIVPMFGRESILVEG